MVFLLPQRPAPAITTLLWTVLGHIGGCPKLSILPITSTGSKIYLQGDKLMGDQEKSSEMSDV